MDFLRNNFGEGPITQVPASWFNRVANFINGLIPSDTVRFIKHLDGSPTILESVPDMDVGENPVEEGSLVCADASVIDQGEETLWEAGGENGCKLQVFFDGDPEGEEGISHTFYAAKLTIGKMGNIVKVERVRHGGAKFTS